jgi:ATP-dependent exoDNAse (exonuclease V) beta subunit
MRVPGDLPQHMSADTSAVRFTDEQLAAIASRDRDLLLDAGAGSGKTSVLVERFARSVIDDEIAVGAILTITFTEKAAAELRDRIRARLRALGALEAARATEGAFISTIHGFCSRVLRANALAAGIDPAFAVLDRSESERLADGAFDDALEELGLNVPGATDLIAAHGVGLLRGAVLPAYGELRSRGERTPRLPGLGPAPDLDAAREELLAAAATAAGELGGVSDPGARVREALDRLEQCGPACEETGIWPGALDALKLPGGNGAALSTAVCEAYSEALRRFRAACEYGPAEEMRDQLDHLLAGFGARYEQRKRERSALDFEDLELMTRDLLVGDGELCERYAARFERIMVDELQDTNAVQLALIESIARGNLFTVGDAQQSIYGFRHADVELFEQRGRRLEATGGRMTLQTNFRSRPEILTAVNTGFAAALGERFRPLRAGRGPEVPPPSDPRVELLIVDKGAAWRDDGLAAPWRIAEARLLAERVAELIGAGASAAEIVLLTRATTDLRTYERALESRGIPTYVIGGRGYWSHPQIVDFLAYLHALENPRDEQALYTVLASPLVGISVDALVVLAAAGRASGRDPWWVLREPEGRLDSLSADDLRRLERFVTWFGAERRGVARRGIEELVERALELSGYDLTMLAMPGGTRRLANVRKLMRLGREHESRAGTDLTGFLELVRGRAAGWAGAGDARESEAPVEGEALDAVRLMTIHRAKGLEFPIVCVADLGRVPRRGGELLRLGRDGRIGLRLARPGSGRKENTLDYRALGDDQMRIEGEEEHRLFYVAMTRAKERLVLSGAVKLDPWPGPNAAEPLAWIGPGLVPDIAERAAAERDVVTLDGASIGLRVAREGDADAVLSDGVPSDGVPSDGVPSDAVAGDGAPSAGFAPAPVTAEPAPAPVSNLSYSSLGAYRRCGYRFYLERVLWLPEAPPLVGQDATGAEVRAADGLTGAERGTVVHSLLERLDFRRPAAPSRDAIAAASDPDPTAEEIDQILALVEAFIASETRSRLAAASAVGREERFAFALGDVIVNGVIDALAREPDERILVVDYKSDRLEGQRPASIVAAGYAVQQLVYGLAALRAGAAAVEVRHLFLERPDEPVIAAFTREDTARLGRELTNVARGVLEQDFRVAEHPHRALCSGCPGEGGLCSWPTEMTRREAVDRLF